MLLQGLGLQFVIFQEQEILIDFPLPLSLIRLFVGHFAEILVYNKNLSDFELNQIKEYFDAKWGKT